MVYLRRSSVIASAGIGLLLCAAGPATAAGPSPNSSCIGQANSTFARELPPGSVGELTVEQVRAGGGREYGADVVYFAQIHELLDACLQEPPPPFP